MTEHVTISLDAEHLARARREAGRLGASLEAYRSHLVQGGLPTSPLRLTANNTSLQFAASGSRRNQPMSGETRMPCWATREHSRFYTDAVAAGSAAISRSSVSAHETSQTPSTRAGRKWRWNAITTYCVAMSNWPETSWP